MGREKIACTIAEIIRDITRHDIAPEQELDLTSLEILKIVAEIEKTFYIEIEDNRIFRGLFNRIDTLSDYVFNKSNNEKVKGMMRKIAEEQRQAFINGDTGLFMKHFDLDAVSDYYTRKLFENYSAKSIQDCRAEIKKLEISEDIRCEVVFTINYHEYEEEGLLLCNKLTYTRDGVLSICEAGIKSINGVLEIDTALEASIHIPPMVCEMKKQGPALRLSQFTRLIHCTGNTCEPLSPSIYSRAVSKSVRYRMAHPEIECGVILANMMSARAGFIADFIRDDTVKGSVKKLNFLFDRLFTQKMHHETRHKDKSSFSVQELSIEPISGNIDELIYQYEMKGSGKVEVDCSEIAQLYASILSLLGMDVEKSLLLLLPFHYMNYLELDNEYFIIDINHITAMNKNRVYGGYNEISGIITPEYFIDQSGNTNMPEEILQSVTGRIHNNLPCFGFVKNVKASRTLPKEAGLSIAGCKGPDRSALTDQIKSHVFEMSRKYPYSPYTWSKYCYQTVLVNYPQAYIIFSLKCQECLELASQIKSIEELFNWVNSSIKDESVYLSPDRIMMGNQVINNGCGREYDRAVLVYTILKLKGYIKTGGIVFCDNGAYISCFNGRGEKTVYTAKDFKTIDKVNEEVLLAFNEETCYSLWNSGENDIPAWL